MAKSQNQLPLISIVLPAYNAGHDIKLAIQSILNQTYQNWEMLLINDGSTDDTLEQMSSFHDSRIKIIGGITNEGLSARLNEGVMLSKGEFIARMDADDFSLPDRLQLQLSFLQQNRSTNLVGGRAIVFDDSLKPIGLIPYADNHTSLTAQTWRYIPIPHPTWMVRASWFKANLYKTPEVKRAEDQELLLRTHKTSEFACIDEVILGYRQGRFSFRSTIMARKSLYVEQFLYFKKHAEWNNLIKSTIITAVKIASDVAMSFPKLQHLLKLRLDPSISPKFQKKFNSCLNSILSELKNK